MHRTILVNDIIPFVLLFAALIGGAILIDGFLHFIDQAWIGRYFGILGTALIAVSFVYSLRKYNMIKKGSLKTLLLWHEYLAWSGSMMILVHGGIHFNAWLPWYAMIAMMIAVASGLTGKYLLNKSHITVESTRSQWEKNEPDQDIIAKRLFLDAVTFEFMKKWRMVHLPITLFFGLLAFLHIMTILVFWRWR
jgi:hypothetical protein